MAHPLKHAESSARKFGGKAEDYLRSTTGSMSRKPSSEIFAIAHSGTMPKGVFLCGRIFGVAITNSEGKQVPVRYIGEQHVRKTWDVFPRHKTGSRKSSPNAGCTASVSPTRAAYP